MCLSSVKTQSVVENSFKCNFEVCTHTSLEYLLLMLFYTLTPLHIREKYCAFYSIKFIWQLFVKILKKQHIVHKIKQVVPNLFGLWLLTKKTGSSCVLSHFRCLWVVAVTVPPKRFSLKSSQKVYLNNCSRPKEVISFNSIIQD